MQFVRNNPAFAASFASESNYPSGHIYRLDDEPAVFFIKNKIDLGLQECRRQILADFANNVGQNATVYGRTSNEYNPTARSAFSTRTRDQVVRAAYNSLDIAFRDKVLGYCKCRDYDFHDMITARGGDAFEVHQRQHLVYSINDHFDNPRLTLGVKGHADDSLFERDMRWRRNDPQRTFVGLLYLTSYNQDADEQSQSEFAGGELLFPLLQNEDGTPVRYLPKYGELVFFPASPMYLHAVPKITAGTRVVVTTWYTVPGYD